MKSRIMYVELKTAPGAQNDRGPARIGRVFFNKSGRTLTYRGKRFQKTRGEYFNHVDVDTGEGYWISGPKKNGEDRYPWARNMPTEIDEDIREEYWVSIRNEPEHKDRTTT